MRKLLNTLFVLSEDSYLAVEGENVLVLRGEETAARFPLHTLESILSFSYKGASPALMGACAKRGVSLVFLTPRGQFLARSCGAENGNVLLRRTQYRMADLPDASCRLARSFICGKIYNCRWILERATRDHALRLDVPQLKAVSAQLHELSARAAQCDDPEELRGLEGKGAAAYFGAFDQLILQQRDDFAFQGRSRRPPLDPINALLSFLYTLLAHDCAAALEAVGLDSYVGFLHRDRPGRTSLALDLMEELRPILADRLALTLVNRKILEKKHFRFEAGGAVFLSEDGRKAVLSAWQERKKEMITHPYLGEKLSWGLVPYTQALLLARYLRGDLDGYPPFFWK
ncbi:MAG: type I-C CRISPR-associated endonuclease Cas1c [Oscillospiraceae bacterium]